MVGRLVLVQVIGVRLPVPEQMKKKIKIIYLFVGVLIGVFMFAYGEIYDNSGAQLIGALAILIGLAGLFIERKKIA